MPIPLLLWGAAAALAATGVVKGVQASNNFDKAKEIGESAERRHKRALAELDKDREATQKSLEKLGELKVYTFTHQIKFLIEAIKRAKSKTASSKLNDFSEDFTIEKIKEYEHLILTSLEIEKGLGTGAVGGALAAMGAYGTVGTLATASTGAAISGLSGAAATNATLAWLGGGALSAGGFGMAGGMLALGGIVLGPALAIGGFMMASKAEEALTQAYAYDANVDTAIAKMETVKLTLKAIRTSVAELTSIIHEIATRFEFTKVDDDSDLKKFDNMIYLGKGLKEVLNIPVLQPNGDANTHIKSQCSGFIELN